jgi:hypothetical protein
LAVVLGLMVIAMERRVFMKFLGGAEGCPLAASGFGLGNCHRDLEAKCEAALEWLSVWVLVAPWLPLIPRSRSSGCLTRDGTSLGTWEQLIIGPL